MRAKKTVKFLFSYVTCPAIGFYLSRRLFVALSHQKTVKFFSSNVRIYEAAIVQITFMPNDWL